MIYKLKIPITVQNAEPFCLYYLIPKTFDLLNKRPFPSFIYAEAPILSKQLDLQNLLKEEKLNHADYNLVIPIHIEIGKHGSNDKKYCDPKFLFDVVNRSHNSSAFFRFPLLFNWALVTPRYVANPLCQHCPQQMKALQETCLIKSENCSKYLTWEAKDVPEPVTG